MSSFLATCPNCAQMIAKGSACPQCRWSENQEEDAVSDQATIEQFAARKKVHDRNNSIFMYLGFATGFIGLLTMMAWGLFIYRGNIVAFVMLAPLTLSSLCLGGFTAVSKNWYPVGLKCPGCDARLDELGMQVEACPACNARLIPDPQDAVK